MRFASFETLILLAALPVLALLFWRAALVRRREMSLFAEADLFSRYSQIVPVGRQVLRAALFLLGLLLGLLALARPQLGSGVEWVKRSGVDIVAAVDTSFSMLAEDVTPNRIEAAKVEIKRLLKGLSGDRVGLIVFAERGYLQFPLTSDYRAASFFVDLLQAGMLPEQGTNLA